MNAAVTVAPIEALVQVDGGQMWTTSKAVAGHFDKSHASVLKAIRALACSAEFGRVNFDLSYEPNSQGKQQPVYRLTRDGFTILAMGFTGERAMAWKERFLEAFNAMERALKTQHDAEHHRTELDLVRTQRRLIQAQRQLLALHRRELRALRPARAAPPPAVPSAQMALGL